MHMLRTLLPCLVVISAFADTLTMKDGRTITGTYLGGTARQLRMEVGDGIQNFDVGDVATLQFESGRANAAPAPDSAAPAVAPAPAAAEGIEIPARTPVTVRMIDSVDSQTNHLGQTFQASVDEPVVVEGQTVIPRGADAVVKLVEDKESGKISGRTELKLVLMSLRVNDRLVDVSTDVVSQVSASRGARSGKVIGGTAALGAIIGGIAGGGRGAAIGAGSGAAVGTGVQAATKGQRVRIPSETRLTFLLASPARI